MISIVVVSHSHALARAAVALAEEMVPEGSRPRVAVAAGLDETTFGTDAAAIAAAIEEVDQPEGTLVLVDLGSAVLSAEMALEFVDPETAGRVLVSPAPLVEGLVSAMVTASTGADLAATDAEARAALAAKTEHLSASGTPATGHESPDEAETPEAAQGSEALDFRATVRAVHGLHARPAAALVAALVGIDAEVQLGNDSTGAGPCSARSLTGIASLALAQNQVLVARITGPQAQQAHDALTELAERDFGDPPSSPEDHSTGAVETDTGAGVSGVVRWLDLAVQPAVEQAGDPEQEAAKLAEARQAATAAIASIESPKPVREVLDAVAALVTDPALTRPLDREIAAGASAVDAAARVHDRVAAQFAAMDNAYLALRAQDLRLVGRLVQRALVGQTLLDELPEAIVAVPELDAATAARLDPARQPAVLVAAPGDDAHGPMVARMLGVRVFTGLDPLPEDGSTFTD